MERLTVAVCTNRYDTLLEKCIRTVIEQCLETGDARALVVSNGDKTIAELVEAFVQNLDAEERSVISVIHEPILGLSPARNKALRDCQSTYIAYIDDDAYPAPGWLKELLNAFHQHNASCVGGPAHLVWLVPRPRWITEGLEKYFTHLDRGNVDIELTNRPELWLAGANIAFCVGDLRALGGFPDSLGRVGRHLLSGEDYWAQIQLRKAGLPIWYCAKALVFHQVRPERVSRRWLVARAYWGGISNQVSTGLLQQETEIASLLKGAVKTTLQLVLLRCSPMEWLVYLAHVAGQLRRLDKQLIAKLRA